MTVSSMNNTAALGVLLYVSYAHRGPPVAIARAQQAKVHYRQAWN